MHVDRFRSSGIRLRTSVGSQLLEGWSYIHSFAADRYSSDAPGVVCAIVTSINSVLAPIFATRVLGGNAHTLGFLMAGSGLGALTAALMLAARRTVVGLGRWIGISAVLLGGSFILFFLSRRISGCPGWRSRWRGLVMMTGGASINTVLQTIVSEEMRGRVMSFFAAAFIGMAPIGNMLGGWVADR